MFKCLRKLSLCTLLLTWAGSSLAAEPVLEFLTGTETVTANIGLSGDGNWITWAPGTSTEVFVQSLETGSQTVAELSTTIGIEHFGFPNSVFPVMSNDGSVIALVASGPGTGRSPRTVFAIDPAGSELARMWALDYWGQDDARFEAEVYIDGTGRYVMVGGYDYIKTVYSSTAGGIKSLSLSGEIVNVFRLDIQNGDIDLVSINSSGREPRDNSLGYGISDNGRYIIFSSEASDLPGANGNAQLYRRDMNQSGVGAVVQVSTDDSSDYVYSFAMSDDGSRVVYSGYDSDTGTYTTYLWKDGGNITALSKVTQNSTGYPKVLSGNGTFLSVSDEDFSRLNLDTDETDDTTLDIDRQVFSNDGNLLVFYDLSLKDPDTGLGGWWQLKFGERIPDAEAPIWPNASLNIVEVDVLQAGLTWGAAEDDVSGLKEYIVYRDDLEIARVNELNYLDTVFAAGTYYYRIEAVDNAGNVSTDGPTESIKLDAPVQETVVVSVPVGYSSDYNGAIGHGEWSELFYYQSRAKVNDESNFGWLELPFGHVIFRHDKQRLDILLNITSDTVDDALIDGGSDQFWLLFDVDRDGKITEGIDRRYLLEPGTGNLRSQTFAEPGGSEQFNPMRKTMSTRAEGFGCFVADETLYEDKNTAQGTVCRRHRVWEVGIDLREIGIDDSDPVARMGIRIISGEPAIQYSHPFNSFDLVNYTELRLRNISTGTLTPEARPAQGVIMINLSQGIEDKNGDEDIPFVAGRPTAVRANILTSDSLEPNARVAVFVSHDSIDVPGSPFISFRNSVYADGDGFFDPLEEDDRGWLILPEVASEAGILDFSAGIYVDGVNSQVQKSATMLPGRELEYWVYGISHDTNDIAAPSEATIDARIRSNMKFLPTSNLSWVYKGEYQTDADNGPDLNRELQTLYDSTMLGWHTRNRNGESDLFTMPDMIVGFTDFKLCQRDPASEKGCGSTESGKSYPVWRSDTGRVFWGKPDSNTFAHEINHNVDRTPDGTWGRHIPNFSGCGSGGSYTDPEWPYPSTNIEAWAHLFHRTTVDSLGPAQDDLMAYCDNRWSSPYRWRSLFYNYFAAPEVVPPASFASVAQSKPINQPDTGTVVEAELAITVDTIYVNGTVNADGTGKLGALLLQPGLPEPPLVAGDYALVQLGCAGETLDSQSFAAFFEGVEGGTLDNDPFQFTLPMHPDLCGAELRHNGEVLAEITQSLNAPVVEILTPVGGDVWDGVQTITWEGFDDDGDALSYSLFYSHDNGTSWTVLTGNLEATEYEVNTDGWIGGEAGRIRVIASDGFNNSITDSPESFTVLANPPRALITFPAADDYMASGEVVELTGIGWEVGGERLKGDALRWYLDDEFIGVGESIGVNLPVGQFTLRLDVVNPDGLTGSDSTSIQPGILFGSGFE